MTLPIIYAVTTFYGLHSFSYHAAKQRNILADFKRILSNLDIQAIIYILYKQNVNFVNFVYDSLYIFDVLCIFMAYFVVLFSEILAF